MEEFLKCVPVLYTEDTSDYESIQNVPCSQHNLKKVITFPLMFVKISVISENKAKWLKHLRDMLMDFSTVAILFKKFLTLI